MMSAHVRYGVIVGLLVALGAGGAAAVVFSPKAAVVSAPRAPVASAQSITVVPPAALSASSTTDTVTVVGTGTVNAIPDEATIVLGVTANRPTVRDAVNAAGVDVKNLMFALHAEGVLDKDIQTMSISIYQQSNCCPQNGVSYTASNQVQVTIHHLNNVNGVIERAVEKVGNDIQLGGINLTIADPAALIARARAAAMADANARAQTWVRLANHHLGGLISLSEIVATFANPCDLGGCGGKGAGGGGGAFQVQPGQTSATITVTATYELLP